MNNEQKVWMEITQRLAIIGLALGWNAFIIGMSVQGSEISVVLWGIYGAIMSAFGIPIVWQGAKKTLDVIGKITALDQ